MKDLSSYDNQVISLSNYEFNEIKNIIITLQKKYQKKYFDIINYEKNKLNKMMYDENLVIKNLVIYETEKIAVLESNLISDLILDLVKIFKEYLTNLECVFLSGSEARGTNKFSSDLDLHFFYRDSDYNFVVEELIYFIITKVIGKSRDLFDPKFILNFDLNNKKNITEKMGKNDLKISIVCDNDKYEYVYCAAKKKRYFIQYSNSRDLNVLYNYLLDEIKDNNREWAHVFKIIYGKDFFEHLYDKLYFYEKGLINDKYIKIKITNLVEKIEKERNFKLNKIKEYKKFYQQKNFDIIFDFLSIIRFILIDKNIDTKYLNINNLKDNCHFIGMDKSEFDIIFDYFIEVKKLALYSQNINIEYSLHSDKKFKYNTCNLDIKWGKLIVMIKERLEKWKQEY